VLIHQAQAFPFPLREQADGQIRDAGARFHGLS
jgi:hypothetical protein